MGSLLISVSGVRGVIGESLTPEVVSRFAAAFGSMMGRGQVVVGRDSRTSGECIRHAVISGLLSAGCTVVDVGICPTPTVQLMAEGASGGIAITASHNTAEWNGLKFIGPDGLFLDEDRGEKLLHLFEERKIHYVKWNELGTVTFQGDASNRHIERIFQVEYIDTTRVGYEKFKVVIDCCNGAVSEIGPEFLRRLGCEVVKLHCQPNGIFPRGPEPVPANLVDLCSTVADCDADVGFAVDPDGDRLSIVSNEGKALGEEYTLALAVQYILSKRKGPVVVNLSTSRMIDDIASRALSTVIRTPVGEINVAKRMKEVGSVIGGEGNGGVILPEAHYGRDALVGMALVLQAMAESGSTISKLVDSIPKYHIVKKRYEPDTVDLEAAMAAVTEHYANQSPDLRDGVKIDWSDRWIHIRRSNTEPILRVIAEAPDQEDADELCNGTIRTIESLIKSQTSDSILWR